MFNQILSILLATSICACPLICKESDSCCDRDTESTHRCCDGRHHGESSHSPNRDPRPADHGAPVQERCCQCVCGGAVVEDASMPQVHLDALRLITLPAADVHVSVATQPQQDLTTWVLLPDDGANPGRNLRYWMMSLIC